MSRSLATAVKLLAEQNVDNMKLCDFTFGKVVSISPLKIQITQQLVLPQEVLIVPKELTDHEIEITIDGRYGWVTEDSTVPPIHNHELKQNKKKVFVHNGLKNGETVILLRKTGGQSYLVLDRM